jgi:elongation factor G
VDQHSKIKECRLYLDAVCAFLPCPLDVEGITGVNPKTEKEEIRKPSVTEPFCSIGF